MRTLLNVTNILIGLPGLRAYAKITLHFCIPSSGHLWQLLNRKILAIVVLSLRFCSIGAAKYDPNLGANSAKLFFVSPKWIEGNNIFLYTLVQNQFYHSLREQRKGNFIRIPEPQAGPSFLVSQLPPQHYEVGFGLTHRDESPIVWPQKKDFLSQHYH